MECQLACAKGEVVAETDEQLLRFNELGFLLAGGKARSLEPLATIFHELGEETFVAVAAALLRLKCTGDLVALAYEICGSDIPCFAECLTSSDDAELGQLVEEVNQAATRHEWVPGNVPIGRAHPPEAAPTGTILVEKSEGQGAAEATMAPADEAPALQAEATHVGDDGAELRGGVQWSWWYALPVVAAVALGVRCHCAEGVRGGWVRG